MGLRRRFDVAALGELVIDLVPALNADGQPCFVPKPGGAPGNVAVGVARLGGRAAMLSKVGDEAFGRLLVATLAGYGVSTDGVLTTRERNTSLAVVSVAADGERDFILYRKGCADTTFAPEEVATDIIRGSRILHVGSLLLGEPVSAAAQRHAVRTAREAGVLVSVDVNLRPSLWRDQQEMRAVALEAAEEADILKVSEEELTILTGVGDVEQGLARLWRPQRRLTAVTFGAPAAPCSRPPNARRGPPVLRSLWSTLSAAATPSPPACYPILPQRRRIWSPQPDWRRWRAGPARRAHWLRRQRARWKVCRQPAAATLFWRVTTFQHDRSQTPSSCSRPRRSSRNGRHRPPPGH